MATTPGNGDQPLPLYGDGGDVQTYMQLRAGLATLTRHSNKGNMFGIKETIQQMAMLCIMLPDSRIGEWEELATNAVREGKLKEVTVRFNISR